MERSTIRTTLVVFTVLVVALIVVLALWPTIVATFSAPPAPSASTTVALEAGPKVGRHLANPFYAVVLTAVNRTTPQLVALGNYLNTTPITWFRYGGGGEGYDPTTGTDYVPPATGGRFVAEPWTIWNLTWFKSWCLSRTPACLWLGYLPAELNRSSAAVETAQWYHSDLGLAPELWQLGNEPEGWSHYGENYSDWSTSDGSAPTSLDYATMAHDYIQAVSAVYPEDRFVGIEASCANCNTGLISGVLGSAEGSIAAMAYHSYPTVAGMSSSLLPFYGALTTSTNLSSTATEFRQALASGCATCANLPVELGEYQAGPHASPSPYASAYPGAVFLAASVIQALRANLSMFTVFDSGALFNGNSDAPTPEGLLYSTVLANMTMGDDYAVGLGDGSVPGAYAILIENGSRDSLLVVDASLSSSFTLTIPASLFPVGAPGTSWSWSPDLPVPARAPWAAIPTTFEVPSQGILLLDNF